LIVMRPQAIPSGSRDVPPIVGGGGNTQP